MSQLTRMIPEVAPEYHSLLTKAASAIQNDPFKDQIIQEMDSIVKKAEASLEGMSKEAMIDPYSTGKKMVNTAKGLRGPKAIAAGTAAGFGVAVAGGIAMALAGDLYESAKRGLTRGRDFKNMLEANPDLRAPSKSAKVKANFSTLHRFNPDFAADPNVAGSYVRNSIDMPGGELASLKDLVKARSDSSKSKQLPSFNPSSIVSG